MNEWIKNTDYVEDVKMEIGFKVSKDYYYGPMNGMSEQQYREMRTPLFQPAIPKNGDFILLKDIEGKECELLKYYIDVIEKHNKYNSEMLSSTYFWNRPMIYNKNGFYISFPWCDRFREGKRILEKFSNSSEGEVYWDRDQGWELEVLGIGNLLFAKESDPDNEEIHCQVKFDWRPIIEKANVLITKTPKFIEYLAKEIGQDYWT